MILTFIVPSSSYPSGGVAVIFEYASRLAGRGHTVHLCHTPFMGADVSKRQDIGWFTFPDGIIHHFTSNEEEGAGIPVSDAIFGFIPDREGIAHTGLPVVLVQGFKMIEGTAEQDAYRAPCPKVCVAEWLVDVGRRLGVPADQLHCIRPGLRHDVFQLRRPIAGRGPRVSFCYSSHARKNATLALAVVAAVRQAVPDLEVTVFGAVEPGHELPSWVTYRTNPPRRELVDDIYNTCRVFLCTSDVEGFGLTSIEAMACGAALVTTANGGSEEYARHDDTALLSPPGDQDGLASQVIDLLRDDDRCRRIAAAGHAAVQHFDWDQSTDALEGFLEVYLADPVAYGLPPDLARSSA